MKPQCRCRIRATGRYWPGTHVWVRCQRPAGHDGDHVSLPVTVTAPYTYTVRWYHLDNGRISRHAEYEDA